MARFGFIWLKKDAHMKPWDALARINIYRANTYPAFRGINTHTVDPWILLIPILGLLLPMGALFLWIMQWHRRRLRELDSRHKERMAAIDKGLLDLPPEPLPQAAQILTRDRYLLRGLVWLGVGLAIVFGIRDLFDSQIGKFGWIPFAIGAAYLIFYFAEGRATKEK
jgi:hypothetical protein